MIKGYFECAAVTALPGGSRFQVDMMVIIIKKTKARNAAGLTGDHSVLLFAFAAHLVDCYILSVAHAVFCSVISDEA